MKKSLSAPLDDDELDRLKNLLLDRLNDETSDEIARADGDEGILDVSELDGFLTAIVSGPNAIPPSQWLESVWGAEAPVWGSTLYEPMFNERVVEGQTYVIVDEWCHGYMRGVAMDGTPGPQAERSSKSSCNRSRCSAQRPAGASALFAQLVQREQQRWHRRKLAKSSYRSRAKARASWRARETARDFSMRR